MATVLLGRGITFALLLATEKFRADHIQCLLNPARSQAFTPNVSRRLHTSVETGSDGEINILPCLSSS